MDIDDIFVKSLTEFTEKEKKNIILSQEDRMISAQKKQKLETIEHFLQKFVDLQFKVYDKEHKHNSSQEPQNFTFYYSESSKTWSPGISIMIEHPAEIEIAIPNKPKEEGVVVINVASEHRDSYILQQKFTNFESACEALGKFISKSTVSIGKDTQKYLKEYHQKRTPPKISKTDDFLNNVPDGPPEENEKSEGGFGLNLSLKGITELFSIRKNKDRED